MSNAVKTHIIRIGHSKGLRIPKLLLDQSGLGEEVELRLQKDGIVIRAAHRPRADWDEQFAAMTDRGDDRLLDGDVVRETVWDRGEWKW